MRWKAKAPKRKLSQFLWFPRRIRVFKKPTDLYNRKYEWWWLKTIYPWDSLIGEREPWGDVSGSAKSYFYNEYSKNIMDKIDGC